ncbi:unnamed protein product [Effrenium voratum]|nr:unnamed protein product [Effrenium voratum]
MLNFRQLALAGDAGMLAPQSSWDNAGCLTAIKRQYVEAATDEADCLTTCIDLLHAAARGDVQHVIELLEKPHDPNAADRIRHVTPLFDAAASGHLEVVRCLLAAGADKEKADNDGATPLHIAAWWGHQAVAQCLLDAGADKEKADNAGESALHLAAVQGHPTVVQCLLDAGADKEKADNAGRSPLHLAAFMDRQAVVQCLLDEGADKEKADKNGTTALFFAAFRGHLAVVHKASCKPGVPERISKGKHPSQFDLGGRAVLAHAQVVKRCLCLKPEGRGTAVELPGLLEPFWQRAATRC